jgi:hypothetical protein
LFAHMVGPCRRHGDHMLMRHPCPAQRYALSPRSPSGVSNHGSPVGPVAGHVSVTSRSPPSCRSAPLQPRGRTLLCRPVLTAPALTNHLYCPRGLGCGRPACVCVCVCVPPSQLPSRALQLARSLAGLDAGAVLSSASVVSRGERLRKLRQQLVVDPSVSLEEFASGGPARPVDTDVSRGLPQSRDWFA